MRGDRGSASVLVLGTGTLLAAFALVCGLIATGLTAHRHAVRAADLAALAGAHRSLSDAALACQTARSVATANGADLHGCALQSGTLLVEVSVRTVAWVPSITASARAGVAFSR
ncbi:MAG TPA: Rv3654c family TadE-like protein [Actinomycetes bacterium]|nr:Rv3654c family TadE-like protein [Actinomycetes bacterium]